MNEKLELIFKNVNDWLKFAEAKNAGLLVFNTGVIFGLLRHTKQLENLSSWPYCYFYFVIILLGISAVLCLISYIPKLEIPWLKQQEGIDTKSRNLLFFGDIAAFSPETLLTELSRRTGEELSSNKFYLDDLSNQIITNSRIALKKYKLFGWAIWFTVSALVTPIAALLIYLCLTGSNK